MGEVGDLSGGASRNPPKIRSVYFVFCKQCCIKTITTFITRSAFEEVGSVSAGLAVLLVARSEARNP